VATLKAHQAVKAARQYVAEGRRVVMDLDLEQFFDRVNHDLLMGKLAQKIDDPCHRLRTVGSGSMAQGRHSIFI
jgi:retron-type reverse transcriptase